MKRPSRRGNSGVRRSLVSERVRGRGLVQAAEGWGNQTRVGILVQGRPMVHELQREYRPALGAPADARHDVAGYLAEVGRSELIPVAAVLVSELVTNSIVHAEGAVRLRAMWAGEVFRVDVSDHGGGVRVASDPEVSGRGLAIVDALATDWGVNRFDGAGRVTWFELR